MAMIELEVDKRALMKNGFIQMMPSCTQSSTINIKHIELHVCFASRLSCLIYHIIYIVLLFNNFKCIKFYIKILLPTDVVNILSVFY